MKDDFECFEKLESLSLGGMAAEPIAFEMLCEKLPNIRNLKLDYKVKCDGNHDEDYNGYSSEDSFDFSFKTKPTIPSFIDKQWLKSRDLCHQTFLNPLSEFKKLRRLKIHVANEASLASLIKDLFDLKELVIGEASDENLIEAFIELAKQKPKEEFRLYLKGGFSDSDLSHIEFPRNLRKYHLKVSLKGKRLKHEVYYDSDYEFEDDDEFGDDYDNALQ